MNCPRKLKPFIEQGCLLQITAGSVAGRFGEPAQMIANALLELGLVTILASDAHNMQHRPPVLSEGMEHAARIVGAFQAERLVIDTPWQIARGHFA
ncbi:Tyrosine-protein phosphatase CpsB [compost metagenome]